jgi:NADH:ubiquinone oxidoreductase subunit E
MTYLKDKFQQQGYLTRDQLKEYAKNNGISYALVKKVLSDLGIKIHDINPGEKKKSTSAGYERCILCGKETEIKSSQEVETRDYFVKGIGQLCKECYQDL